MTPSILIRQSDKFKSNFPIFHNFISLIGPKHCDKKQGKKVWVWDFFWINFKMLDFIFTKIS